MTDTTIFNKWFEMLKSVFNHAQRGQHITHNPITALMAGQKSKHPEKPPRDVHGRGVGDLLHFTDVYRRTIGAEAGRRHSR